MRHSDEQLLLRHFEAEHADRPAGLRPDMLRHVQRQRRFAHRRTGGDDDEIARLEPGRQLVEIREPGRYTGDELLAFVRALNRLEAGVRQRAHRHEAFAHAIFRDGENRLLCLVQDEIGFLLGFVRVGENLVGGENQVSKRGFFADDPRVVLHVGGVGQSVRQRRDVGGPAHFVELSGPRQLFLQRDEIDGVPPLAEVDHFFEDAPMRIPEKIAGLQNFGRRVERVVVDEDRTQHGSLRLEVMGQRAIDGSGLWHGECGLQTSGFGLRAFTVSRLIRVTGPKPGARSLEPGSTATLLSPALSLWAPLPAFLLPPPSQARLPSPRCAASGARSTPPAS